MKNIETRKAQIQQVVSDLNTSFSDHTVLESRARKQTLEKLLNESFDNPLTKILAPQIRELAFEKHRDTFNDNELEAIARLNKFIFEFDQLQGTNIKDVHRNIFLQDVARSLLEKSYKIEQSPIIIKATTCPDYAFDAAQRSYLSRGGLGDGFGLSAQNMTKGLLGIAAALTKAEIKFTVDFAFADIESRDSDMLNKVKLTKSEFMRQVLASRLATESAVKDIFSAQGIVGNVTTSGMSELLSQDLQFGQEVPRTTADGMVLHRASFYKNFFADALGQQPHEFMRARAQRDITDHLQLGDAVAMLRNNGERVTIATMSIPALAKYLNHDNRQQVAILCIES